MDIKRARTAAGLAAGILLAAVGVTGCTTTQAGQGKAAPAGTGGTVTTTGTVTATVPASTTAAAAEPTATTSRAPAATEDTKNTENTENTEDTEDTEDTEKTANTETRAPDRPRIASFTVVTQPSCPVVGTPDAPFSSPGSGVVIAWEVRGADGAAISVDNPGVYGAYGGDYPATGSLELAFPCDGGGDTTHTYTVWPKGAEGVHKTLTVTARASS
jgi:hypothetical protein